MVKNKKKLKKTVKSPQKSPSSKNPNFSIVSDKLLYVILIVAIFSLIISSYTLYELKFSDNTDKTISLNDFLQKLTSNQELANYKGISPQNIITIDESNLPGLQTQIVGLDSSHIGKFIVQYDDRIVLYDYDNNNILLNEQVKKSEPMPEDFFKKLLAHQELSGVEQENPQGGLLDSVSLQSLQTSLPDVYKDAKVGDYLLRYSDRLIIYDYNSDKIVNAVQLQ